MTEESDYTFKNRPWSTINNSYEKWFAGATKQTRLRWQAIQNLKTQHDKLMWMSRLIVGLLGDVEPYWDWKEIMKE